MGPTPHPGWDLIPPPPKETGLGYGWVRPEASVTSPLSFLTKSPPGVPSGGASLWRQKEGRGDGGLPEMEISVALLGSAVSSFSQLYQKSPYK